VIEYTLSGTKEEKLMPDVKQEIQIWPIGSGKGGVGKTLLTANLGILLSRLNKKVIILDADLGASNLHTALGIPYLRRTLNDLLTGSVKNLSDLMVETPIENLFLIGGSRHLPAYPNYRTNMTRKILAGVPHLDADILLIDLGGGIAPHVLDFFLLSDRGIAVMTDDPASIQNTYHFLKMAVFQKILKTFPSNPLVSYMVHSATRPGSREQIKSVPELIDKISHVDHYYADVIRKNILAFTPRIIVNMLNDKDDTRAADVVSAVSNKFVGVSPELLGTLEYDQGIKESTSNIRPFTLDPGNMKAAEELNLIANRILETPVPEAPPEWSSEILKEKPAKDSSLKKETREVWLMDNIRHKDQPLHILTEKLNLDGTIQTSIYLHGRILFSKKVKYSELSGIQLDEKAVEKLVRRQHLAALKGVEKGRLHFRNEE
jgi:flagellar biosynthesis protein FlhG